LPHPNSQIAHGKGRHPNNPDRFVIGEGGGAAANVLGVRLLVLRASNLKEVEAAFATLVAQRVGAVQVTGDPTFFTWREQLAALAAHHRVPAIYVHRETVEAGGLISYATDFVEG
jgi:putative tryptophan/tyrosine transport system substrate-binding protein